MEKEIEVLDVDLLTSEFFTLETELKHCFNEDAFTALKSNYETCRNHCRYILPVYPGSDETYWLFFYLGNAINKFRINQCYGNSDKAYLLHNLVCFVL